MNDTVGGGCFSGETIDPAVIEMRLSGEPVGEPRVGWVEEFLFCQGLFTMRNTFELPFVVLDS